jgi:molybdate transport system substrate-binding protein
MAKRGNRDVQGGKFFYGVRTCAVFLFILLDLPHLALARDEIRVAVAANFITPFKEISTMFEAKTGIHVEPVFSSTGKLYAQIIEGAPYDVFLSADEKRPHELNQKGLSGKPFVYVKGEVVLWTAKSALCRENDWKAVVTGAGTKKIAIASTETAPYGTAAMIALKEAKVWESIQGKLVFPQDVAQSFQYAFTGSVDAGFCALSSALSEQGKTGCYLAVKEAPEIVQAACVLNRSARKYAAEKFAAFLLSREADAVKGKYGYK